MQGTRMWWVQRAGLVCQHTKPLETHSLFQKARWPPTAVISPAAAGRSSAAAMIEVCSAAASTASRCLSAQRSQLIHKRARVRDQATAEHCQWTRTGVKNNSLESNYSQRLQPDGKSMSRSPAEAVRPSVFSTDWSSRAFLMGDCHKGKSQSSVGEASMGFGRPCHLSTILRWEAPGPGGWEKENSGPAGG